MLWNKAKPKLQPWEPLDKEGVNKETKHKL